MASQQLGNNYNNEQHASAVRNYYYERENQDIGVSRMISLFRNRVSAYMPSLTNLSPLHLP